MIRHTIMASKRLRRAAAPIFDEKPENLGNMQIKLWDDMMVTKKPYEDAVQLAKEQLETLTNETKKSRKVTEEEKNLLKVEKGKANDMLTKAETELRIVRQLVFEYKLKHLSSINVHFTVDDAKTIVALFKDSITDDIALLSKKTPGLATESDDVPDSGHENEEGLTRGGKRIMGGDSTASSTSLMEIAPSSPHDSSSTLLPNTEGNDVPDSGHENEEGLTGRGKRIRGEDSLLPATPQLALVVSPFDASSSPLTPNTPQFTLDRSLSVTGSPLNSPHFGFFFDDWIPDSPPHFTVGGSPPTSTALVPVPPTSTALVPVPPTSTALVPLSKRPFTTTPLLKNDDISVSPNDATQLLGYSPIQQPSNNLVWLDYTKNEFNLIVNNQRRTVTDWELDVEKLETLLRDVDQHTSLPAISQIQRKINEFKGEINNIQIPKRLEVERLTTEITEKIVRAQEIPENAAQCTHLQDVVFICTKVGLWIPYITQLQRTFIDINCGGNVEDEFGPFFDLCVQAMNEIEISFKNVLSVLNERVKQKEKEVNVDEKLFNKSSDDTVEEVLTRMKHVAIELTEIVFDKKNTHFDVLKQARDSVMLIVEKAERHVNLVKQKKNEAFKVNKNRVLMHAETVYNSVLSNLRLVSKVIIKKEEKTSVKNPTEALAQLNRIANNLKEEINAIKNIDEHVTDAVWEEKTANINELAQEVDFLKQDEPQGWMALITRSFSGFGSIVLGKNQPVMLTAIETCEKYAKDAEEWFDIVSSALGIHNGSVANIAVDKLKVLTENVNLLSTSFVHLTYGQNIRVKNLHVEIKTYSQNADELVNNAVQRYKDSINDAVVNASENMNSCLTSTDLDNMLRFFNDGYGAYKTVIEQLGYLESCQGKNEEETEKVVTVQNLLLSTVNKILEVVQHTESLNSVEKIDKVDGQFSNVIKIRDDVDQIVSNIILAVQKKAERLAEETERTRAAEEAQRVAEETKRTREAEEAERREAEEAERTRAAEEAHLVAEAVPAGPAVDREEAVGPAAVQPAVPAVGPPAVEADPAAPAVGEADPAAVQPEEAGPAAPAVGEEEAKRRVAEEADLEQVKNVKLEKEPVAANKAKEEKKRIAAVEKEAEETTQRQALETTQRQAREAAEEEKQRVATESERLEAECVAKKAREDAVPPVVQPVVQADPAAGEEDVVPATETERLEQEARQATERVIKEALDKIQQAKFDGTVQEIIRANDIVETSFKVVVENLGLLKEFDEGKQLQDQSNSARERFRKGVLERYKEFLNDFSVSATELLTKTETLMVIKDDALRVFEKFRSMKFIEKLAYNEILGLYTEKGTLIGQVKTFLHDKKQTYVDSINAVINGATDVQTLNDIGVVFDSLKSLCNVYSKLKTDIIRLRTLITEKRELLGNVYLAPEEDEAAFPKTNVDTDESKPSANNYIEKMQEASNTVGNARIVGDVDEIMQVRREYNENITVYNTNKTAFDLVKKNETEMQAYEDVNKQMEENIKKFKKGINEKFTDFCTAYTGVSKPFLSNVEAINNTDMLNVMNAYKNVKTINDNLGNLYPGVGGRYTNTIKPLNEQIIPHLTEYITNKKEEVDTETWGNLKTFVTDLGQVELAEKIQGILDEIKSTNVAAEPPASPPAGNEGPFIDLKMQVERPSGGDDDLVGGNDDLFKDAREKKDLEKEKTAVPATGPVTDPPVGEAEEAAPAVGDEEDERVAVPVSGNSDEEEKDDQPVKEADAEDEENCKDERQLNAQYRKEKNAISEICRLFGYGTLDECVTYALNVELFSTFSEFMNVCSVSRDLVSIPNVGKGVDRFYVMNTTEQPVVEEDEEHTTEPPVFDKTKRPCDEIKAENEKLKIYLDEQKVYMRQLLDDLFLENGDGNADRIQEKIQELLTTFKAKNDITIVHLQEAFEKFKTNVDSIRVLAALRTDSATFKSLSVFEEKEVLEVFMKFQKGDVKHQESVPKPPSDCENHIHDVLVRIWGQKTSEGNNALFSKITGGIRDMYTHLGEGNGGVKKLQQLMRIPLVVYTELNHLDFLSPGESEDSIRANLKLLVDAYTRNTISDDKIASLSVDMMTSVRRWTLTMEAQQLAFAQKIEKVMLNAANEASFHKSLKDYSTLLMNHVESLHRDVKTSTLPRLLFKEDGDDDKCTPQVPIPQTVICYRASDQVKFLLKTLETQSVVQYNCCGRHFREVQADGSFRIEAYTFKDRRYHVELKAGL